MGGRVTRRAFRLVGGPLDGTRQLVHLDANGWPPNGIGAYDPPRSWVTDGGFGVTEYSARQLIYLVDIERLPTDVEGPRDLVYVYDWRADGRRTW